MEANPETGAVEETAGEKKLGDMDVKEEGSGRSGGAEICVKGAGDRESR